MQTRPLGSTGLQVGAIGLGAMPLSLRPSRPSEDDALGVIHHAIASGINLIDTADAYCIDDTETGHNERLIGKALSQLPPHERDKLVVATKGGLVRPGGRWVRNGRPDHLRAACEHSLQCLGVEAITLYQYHAPDPKVPLAESIGELKKLQDEGKIRHIGVSNFATDQLEKARRIASVVSIQNEYSPSCRDPELDGTLAESQALRLAFLPWSPLGGMDSAKALGDGDAVIEHLARRHRASPQRLALAWLLSKGPMVIPIPGASRRESIDDSIHAADLILSVDELAELDRCWA
ncbi:aldo/keto reductase [Planctomycetales bacterium ZRK34]|nr:aldo/keto reductase [Planctomycetales bacterium ZRK34]